MLLLNTRRALATTVVLTYIRVQNILQSFAQDTLALACEAKDACSTSLARRKHEVSGK